MEGESGGSAQNTTKLSDRHVHAQNVGCDACFLVYVRIHACVAWFRLHMSCFDKSSYCDVHTFCLCGVDIDDCAELPCENGGTCNVRTLYFPLCLHF